MGNQSLMIDEAAPLSTVDGSLTMRHPVHGEAYHSTDGARREAEDLYMVASGCAARMQSQALDRSIHVLDVGLGLGYNALATIKHWYDAPNPPALTISSLEIDEPLFAKLRTATGAWQSNWSLFEKDAVGMFEELKPGVFASRMLHPNRASSSLSWKVYLGDAASVGIPSVGAIDYVWQDPFSPRLNPTLWDQAWFGKLAAIGAADAVLMTYSVSRLVKDALTASGWNYEVIPTTTCKRSWLRATRMKIYI